MTFAKDLKAESCQETNWEVMASGTVVPVRGGGDQHYLSPSRYSETRKHCKVRQCRTQEAEMLGDDDRMRSVGGPESKHEVEDNVQQEAGRMEEEEEEEQATPCAD